eukprot:scaffold273600_cov36-Tisochrysis_lutea.AAC.3
MEGTVRRLIIGLSEDGGQLIAREVRDGREKTGALRLHLASSASGLGFSFYVRAVLVFCVRAFWSRQTSLDIECSTGPECSLE